MIPLNMYHRATQILRIPAYNSLQKHLSTFEHQKNFHDPQQDLPWEYASPVSEIPSPPKHRIFGHALLLRKYSSTLHKLHQMLYQEYGNIVRLQNPGSPDIICIYDPKDSVTMLNNEGKTPEIAFFDPIIFYRTEFRKELFPSAGLVSRGEEWYKNRQAVQQDMSKVKSAMYYIKDITEIAIELRRTIEERRGFDSCVSINELLKLWALETTAITFIGKRFKCLSNDPMESAWGREMIEASETFMTTSTQMNFMPPIWKSIPRLVPTLRKHDKAMKDILRLTKDHVDAALANIDVADESDQSIIAKFVRRNGDGSPICLAMAIDALLAGIDTTGNTATILLHHLGRNPQKQQVLYKEISDVIGCDVEEIDEVKMSQMKYLKACLSESQRLLPITIGTARISPVDMVLSGYQIPKGTFILRGGQVMSNDPANFHEPEKYIPERWLRGHPLKNSAHPHASLPFGHGPRNCVGKRFALLEIQILVIKLLQKYKIVYEGDDIELETALVSKPKSDVIIKFIKRSASC